MTSQSDVQFDVFLCHNSKDKPEVKQIGEQLRRQGLKPWLDEWEFRPGLPWQRELERQIGHIKSAAVFVGSSGFGPWQEHELDAFLREFVKRECPVIPVLLPTAPQQPILPIFLSSYMWVDFLQQQPEPMGQLIWGITGIKLQNYQTPIIPSKIDEEIEDDDLRSDEGVDYTRLRDLLKAGNWIKADRETLKLMLAATYRETEGWLDVESIERLPCTDLRTIDQLWVKYSKGRFGFSIQKRIWESIGGNPNADNETWCNFYKCLGWRVNDFGMNYSEVLQTPVSRGYLPQTMCLRRKKVKQITSILENFISMGERFYELRFDKSRLGCEALFSRIKSYRV